MSDKDKIQRKVLGLRRTKRWQVVLDYFVRGLFWGAVPAALLILASRIWIIPYNEYILAAGLLGLTVLGFLIASAFVRVTPLSVANDIDLSLGVRERISSALSLSEGRQRKDPFVKTLVKDAAGAVKDLPLKRVYPWRIPPSWRLALPALIIAGLLSFVPQLNWFVSDEDKAEAKLVQAEGNKLLELAKELEKESEKHKDPVLKEQAKEIKRVGEKLNNQQIKKKEALKELQRLKEKLETQAQNQLPQGEKELMAELGEQLKRLDGTRELGEMLKDGNLQKLMSELDQMMQDLQAGKLNSLQKETLEDLLKALEETLKSDQAQSEDAQHLKQLMEELKQALQNEQALQEQLQGAMDAFENDMNQLTQQLQQNNMGQQAQQLQQQMNQMKQELQQNGALSQQSLQQMLQSLQNNQQAIQSNNSLSQQQQEALSQCNQQAQSHLQSPSGQPGQISQANSQAQQNRQSMAQKMQESSDCMGGG
jgi:hypothetical protein